jgi:hypothetical protein
VVTWEEIRHQVAIAGRVIDAQTGQAFAGALVEITAAPGAFSEWLAIKAKQFGARWATMVERPDRTRSAADGHFHFLDLLDGQYALTASLPGTGSRYGTAQVQVTVSRDDGNIAMAAADLALHPTTLKGHITDQGSSDPVFLAEVRVKGSGEKAFSDSQGGYLLTSLETGERTVQVFLQGYQPVSKTALLGQAGVIETLNFTLSK